MSWGTEFSTNVLIKNTTINSVKDAERLIDITAGVCGVLALIFVGG